MGSWTTGKVLSKLRGCTHFSKVVQPFLYSVHNGLVHHFFFFLISFYKRIAPQNGKNSNFTKKVKFRGSIFFFEIGLWYLNDKWNLFCLHDYAIEPPTLAHFYIRFEHFYSHIGTIVPRSQQKKTRGNIDHWADFDETSTKLFLWIRRAGQAI